MIRAIVSRAIRFALDGLQGPTNEQAREILEQPDACGPTAATPWSVKPVGLARRVSEDRGGSTWLTWTSLTVCTQEVGA